MHAAEGQPPPAVYRHSCTPLGGDRFLVAGGYTFAPSISSEELDGGRHHPHLLHGPRLRAAYRKGHRALGGALLRGPGAVPAARRARGVPRLS